MPHRLVLPRTVWPASLFAVAIIPLAAVAAIASTPTDARWPSPTVRLSGAYERMLRDQMAEGRALPLDVIRRFGLDFVDPETAVPEPGSQAPRAAPLGPGEPPLGPDALINDRSVDQFACGPCSNRPLSQSETTIAALGRYVLAGWNNTRGFCFAGAIQGYGYSVDRGLTWKDARDPPALDTGGRYRGDPVHAVNARTGEFYILGLYEGSPSGLALARGHFDDDAFVFDDNRLIAAGTGGDFLDKPWMAADSSSGNLYVTYTRFSTLFGDRIEMIRSVDDGASWDPPVVISPPASYGLVQGSRPAVGPNGEVHVVWYEAGAVQSHMWIRTSLDRGQSFTPDVRIADFYENRLSGSPGFHRPGGISFPSIAVDRSLGPHRGRVHVAWDESVNFLDAPFTELTAKSEVESNDTYGRATPFTVGDVVRGTFLTTSDIDIFRFSALQGQTVVFVTDSSTTSSPFVMRLVCGPAGSASSSLFLTYTGGQHPGLVFTVPNDGEYYLRLTPASETPPRYKILTAFDTPSPGERARDHRDHFAAWSDDGETWSAPQRINDDPPWFDGEFPEITVDGNGFVHAFWHDFRDDFECGARSTEYLVTSTDGGVTWGANQRISDALSFWSINSCGDANQGDYQGITSDGGTVYPCWADSRFGDPDVFAQPVIFAHRPECPFRQPAPAGLAFSTTFLIGGPPSAPGDFQWKLEDDRGWLASATPALAGIRHLGPGASLAIRATLNMPAACAGEDTIRLIVTNLNLGPRDTCTTSVYCVATTGVTEGLAASLAFLAPEPNPAAAGVRFRYSLARTDAELAIYAADGRRIRALRRARETVGSHVAEWDGRDDRGRRLPAGCYFARLRVDGTSLDRAVVLIR
jgi:hypothetical protein